MSLGGRGRRRRPSHLCCECSLRGAFRLASHAAIVTAVEAYVRTLHEVFGSGAATPETSHYPALANLLNAVGDTLRPRRFVVSQLANKGAGLPDYGVFDEAAAGTGVPNNVLEAKPFGDSTVRIATSAQVSKYAAHYDAVLVTNYHQFLLVAKDEVGIPQLEQRYSLTATAAELRAAHPRDLAERHADGLFAYLALALSRTAPIRSGAVLATVLASHAHEALMRLETSPGKDLKPLRETLEAMLGLHFADDQEGLHFFHTALVQTLFYGLFSAWVLTSSDQPPDWEFDWRTAGDQADIPLIGALFSQAGAPQRITRLGLRDPMSWAQSTLNRVDRSAFHKEFEQRTAVQYFYEPFLHAFDPLLRSQLGVWYTPHEVVRYQVAKIHRLLRDELGLAGGLANEKVTVLDPAAGTGSYLLEVARVIYDELGSAPETAALAAAEVSEALRTRIFGFELLPAPFVVSHLQLTLFLRQHGATLGDNERVGVYLTNALTGWQPGVQPPLVLWDETFEEEREHAARVKQDEPILVVLGNPPYSRYTAAAIAEEQDLVAYYKGQVDKDGHTHRPSLLYKQWGGVSKQTLDDLYIRFFSVAEKRIRARGVGVVSLITNSGWLTGASNPIMRESLLESFDRIWIDDLHGGAHSGGRPPAGEADDSVFKTSASTGISISVAITTMLKNGRGARPIADAWHRDIWGTPSEKRMRLRQDAVPYNQLQPRRELRWVLRPVEHSGTEDYLSWRELNGEIFRRRFSGVHTGRDGLVIHPDRQPLDERVKRYYDPELTDEEVARHDPALMTPGNEYKSPGKVRESLLQQSDHSVVRCAFRPFDVQWLWWERQTKLIQRNAEDLYDQIVETNPLLITDARQYKQLSDHWDGLYVTSRVPLSKLTQAGCKVFPLKCTTTMMGKEQIDSNVLDEIVDAILDHEGADLGAGTERLAVAEEVFFHVVAVLHAPMYRRDYQSQLATTGARVPIPVDRDVLEVSSRLGRRVAQLFDTEAGVVGVDTGERDARLRGIATLIKGDGSQVRAEDLVVSFGKASEGGRWTEAELTPGRPEELGPETDTVVLNEVCGFTDIPRRVANYSVGQYPVLRKWLAYRRYRVLARPLTFAEARMFTRIAHRIGALLLLEPALDDNFLVVATSPLVERPSA